MAVEDKQNDVAQGPPTAKEIAAASGSAPSSDQRTPENFWQAATHIIWKWKPGRRNTFLVVVGVVFLLYLVWNTLPEGVKTNLLTRLPGEQDKQLTPNTNTIPDPSGRDSVRTDAITFHDYYETYVKLQGRFLEKEEFSKRLIGAQVTWIGYVDSVSALGDGKSALIIRSSHKSSFPGEDFWQAIVRFDDDKWQTKLYSFRPLDKVRMTGIIKNAGFTPWLEGVSVSLAQDDRN